MLNKFVATRNFKKNYDVVVVGGGMAGVCAAIASARHGCKTALIQARPVYSGNASSEIRMHILGATCHMEKKDLCETGILMEILLENKYRNPTQSYAIWDTVVWEKVHFQENLIGYLNTNMDSVEMDGDCVAAIVCHQLTTETTYRITGNIFIDATGNGTLGFFAGAEYRIGSEGRDEFNEAHAPEEANPYTMGNSIMFAAEDTGKQVPYVKPDWAYSFTEEDLALRPHGNMVFENGENGIKQLYDNEGGYWWIELGGISKDIIAETENIQGELYKCLFGIWDHLKNGGNHGAENYAMTWIGAVQGMRESRRLIGDYLLNERDIYENRIFDDAVAYGGWPMDEHPPKGIFDFYKLPMRFLNFLGAYSIPYRCYYSKNISNLMMAGRDISTTKMALGTTRVMATCAVGGQAVGTAAAIAVKYACKPREVSDHMAELQQMLLKDDCYIPGRQNEDPKDIVRDATATASSFTEGHEPSMMLTGVTRGIGAVSNCWESRPIGENGETLSLSLPIAAVLHELRITFDPNLTKEFMPSVTKAIIDRQVKGIPVELVKTYEVRVYNDRVCTYSARVEENYQRLNIHHLPDGIRGDCIKVTVMATHGFESARIFEIRAY